MKKDKRKRIPLKKAQRELIFKKTEGCCRVYGCKIGGKWAADHIVPYTLGGECDINNFLPCCYECYRLRWFYEPQTLKQI